MSEYRLEIGIYEGVGTVGQFPPRFQVEGVVHHQTFARLDNAECCTTLSLTVFTQ